MIAKAYINYGLTRDTVLFLTGLTKHHLYYESIGTRPGKRPKRMTKFKDHATQHIKDRPNEELVKPIITIMSKQD